MTMSVLLGGVNVTQRDSEREIERESERGGGGGGGREIGGRVVDLQCGSKMN